jgi:hypothetical protein
VTIAWRSNDDSASTTGTASAPAASRPAVPALHQPAASTERLATTAEIARHARSDATVHIPAPMDATDSSTTRRRWDGVAAWDDPAPARVAEGRRVVGPLTAAVPLPPPSSPAVAPPPATPRRSGTVTTRVAALIAAGAFVVGAAAAVLVGAIGGPGEPPAGAGTAPPGMSAPGGGTSSGTDGSSASGSGAGSST